MKRQRSDWKILAASFVLFIALTAAVGQSTESSATTTPKTEWPLPSSIGQIIPEMSVTSDGRYVVLAGVSHAASIAPEPTTPVKHLIDLNLGKQETIEELLPTRLKKEEVILRVLPSLGGKHFVITVHNFKTRFTVAYVLDVVARQTKQIGRGQELMCAWAGDKIILSRMQDGILQHPEVLTKSGKKIKALQIRGAVAAADKTGKVLIAVCHKNDPKKPVSVNDKQAALMAIKPDGTIIKRLAVPTELSSEPVLSPSTKYVAFQIRGAKEDAKNAPIGAMPKLSFRVVSLTTGEKRTIQYPAIPLAVTDRGEVIAIKAILGPRGIPIKLFKADEDGRTLVKWASAGAVCGDTLFYVTPADPPFIKKIKLQQ